MSDEISASVVPFGRALRRHRVAAGLTQEQLAERAGLSARAVSDLERDAGRMPRRDTLDLLADALALTAEERAALAATVSRARPAPGTQEQASPADGEDRNATDTAEDADGGLPAQPTAFIGREREVAAVQARLLDPETRLLTLTGPGGVGKTRLALAVAAAARASFANGVAFVPLAALSDPNLVLPTVAHTLDVAEAPGQPLAYTLAGALRTKHLLLVLDNFEQVLPAAEQVLALLLAASRVTVLVTSRAALHVRGERLYPVPSLQVPTPPLPPLEALSQYEAVKLFIARAQDADPGFAVTNATAPAVAEICARLDGLPLAIELAAARIRLLTPEALLARLANRLKVATGGARDLPARQQTLRAAIEWSHALLSPDEQVLFRRLAVFAGGRTLEAIEAVCAADGDLGLDVLEGVESLVDKSLLRREADADGEPRLVLLETIHEYARERLAASGKEETLRRAHTTYYLALAEKAEAQLMGAEQGRWLARLEQEHDNLRAALTWAEESGEELLGLRMAGALGRFWELSGHWQEGQRHLRAELARPASVPSAVRARVLLWAGFLASLQGPLQEAQDLLEEALPHYRTGGNQSDLLTLLSGLGDVAKQRGEYADAVRYETERLDLAKHLDDRFTIAGSLNNLGIIAQERGDLARAADLLEQSLSLFRRLDHRPFIAMVRYNQSRTAMLQGNYAEAETAARESMEVCQTLGIKRGMSLGTQLMAWTALFQGSFGTGLADARSALALQYEMGDVPNCSETLRLIGHCLQEVGQGERAARMYGAAEALRERTGAVIEAAMNSVYDSKIAALRTQLAPETFVRDWAAGRALTLEDAVAEALRTAL